MLSSRELVLIYDRILDNLDRNNENYPKTWCAISKRRDQIVEKNSLYSKKIKLKKNWYKPYTITEKGKKNNG